MHRICYILKDGKPVDVDKIAELYYSKKPSVKEALNIEALVRLMVDMRILKQVDDFTVKLRLSYARRARKNSL